MKRLEALFWVAGCIGIPAIMGWNAYMDYQTSNDTSLLLQCVVCEVLSISVLSYMIIYGITQNTR
jgi:hypothetical protein